MAKIVGLGGVFVHFEGDEKEVHKWYQDFFGLDMTEYGTGFIEGEQLVLVSFKRMREISPFLNFRVDDIDAIFDKIKIENLEIVDPVKEYEYGKFGQFKDPFGNVIELWEPYVDEYKKMVQKEIEEYKKGKL